MFTKQIILNRLQEINGELDALINFVSNSDKIDLEDELGEYFDTIIDSISLYISFTEDLFIWKERGIGIHELKSDRNGRTINPLHIKDERKN